MFLSHWATEATIAKASLDLWGVEGGLLLVRGPQNTFIGNTNESTHIFHHSTLSKLQRSANKTKKTGKHRIPLVIRTRSFTSFLPEDEERNEPVPICRKWISRTRRISNDECLFGTLACILTRAPFYIFSAPLFATTQTFQFLQSFHWSPPLVPAAVGLSAFENATTLHYYIRSFGPNDVLLDAFCLEWGRFICAQCTFSVLIRAPFA